MEMANIDENDVLDAEALNDLYHWIDAVPLSRPKKNIARDFSDGGMTEKHGRCCWPDQTN